MMKVPENQQNQGLEFPNRYNGPGGGGGRYRMDHAVTATQKTILGAFGMDAKSVKNRANELSEFLAGIEE